MRKTTIRFTPEQLQEVEREATRTGVSIAQFVRDAAMFRLGYLAGVRDKAAVDREVRSQDQRDRGRSAALGG